MCREKRKELPPNLCREEKGGEKKKRALREIYNKRERRERERKHMAMGGQRLK